MSNFGVETEGDPLLQVEMERMLLQEPKPGRKAANVGNLQIPIRDGDTSFGKETYSEFLDAQTPVSPMKAALGGGTARESGANPSFSAAHEAAGKSSTQVEKSSRNRKNSSVMSIVEHKKRLESFRNRHNMSVGVEHYKQVPLSVYSNVNPSPRRANDQSIFQLKSQSGAGQGFLTTNNFNTIKMPNMNQGSSYFSSQANMNIMNKTS